MDVFTQQGRELVQQLSNKYNLSTGAVEAMLHAVNAGNGSMAQFNIQELGGMGQWMRGGMTMVGDMFNNNLKFTVDQLCNELSQALNNQVIYAPKPVEKMDNTQTKPAVWWPSDWGYPSSQGAQNQSEYAYFPHINRLAVRTNNQVILYDSTAHQISGFSQQQPEGTLLFNSQNGTFPVAALPVIRH